MGSFVCPLCRQSAEAEVHPMRHLAHVRCSVCTEFVIKDGAVNWLNDEALDAGRQYSMKAQTAPAGLVLFIFQPPSADRGTRWIAANYLSLQEALHQ